MADPKATTLEYIVNNGLKEVLDEAVNEILELRPEDVPGALSRIMKRRALPPTVQRVVGREVLDSRGNPTVEVDVYAKYLGETVFAGRSSAPSGASTGSNEARELRDEDPARYGGKGTLKASANVDAILTPALKDLLLDNLFELDRAIQKADGTDLKKNVGGNATTATSFALAEAAANLREEQLFLYLSRQFHREQPEKFRMPRPFFNILNGGKHAGGELKIQEFMVTPREDIPFPEQLRVVAEVYQKLGALLAQKYTVSAKNLGDEGGFAPNLNTPEQAISVIVEAVEAAGYRAGTDIFIALDAAASEFYNKDQKKYEPEKGVFKTGEEMIQYWSDLIDAHPYIISIEDPLDEKDYPTWIKMNEELGERIMIVGDDLYTTNPKTIRQGIENHWANALLLKVNQIGTISEAFAAARLILHEGQKVMVSHRSGETCNSVIADIAVAIGAQCIKTGSCARGERIQKYTRLLQIYEYLKENNLLAED